MHNVSLYYNIIGDAAYLVERFGSQVPFTTRVLAISEVMKDDQAGLNTAWTRLLTEYEARHLEMNADDMKMFQMVKEHLRQMNSAQLEGGRYRFVKEGLSWYIDLPEYLEQGGDKGDLAMIAGADSMLEHMAEGSKEVIVQMDTMPFEGADELELLRICDPATGGGDYVLRSFEGKQINHSMWLCAVTEYVFGYLPEKIYIKRMA